MRKMFQSKKGVTPLIATVLLIGFTVALAGVVITWGGGFVERITSGTEERTDIAITCTGDLRFEIDRVKCPNIITIENKGRIKIEEFIIRFFNSNGELTGESQTIEGLESYKIKEFNLAKDIPKGTSRVRAVASIILEGEKVTCADSEKERGFTPPC